MDMGIFCQGRKTWPKGLCTIIITLFTPSTPGAVGQDMYINSDKDILFITLFLFLRTFFRW